MTDEPVNEDAAPTVRNRSPEIKELATALAKAQGAMENASKDAENPGFKRDGKNSTYATLASVWDVIRKPLSDNGLAILQWPRTVQAGVEVETELLHESGQFMRDILWLPCPTMTVHTVGSAITYARRYALMSIVGIAPEDDDGNSAAEAHKPGATGSAGAGGQFRPDKRTSSSNGRRMAAEEPHLATTREKGTLPKEGVGREATPEQARIAKFTAATEKRITALKEGPWTPDTLKKFWDDDGKWRDWMADPANEALAQYDRYTTAFTDAQYALQEGA